MSTKFTYLILILSLCSAHVWAEEKHDLELIAKVELANSDPESEELVSVPKIVFELGKKISSIPASAERFVRRDEAKKTEAGICENCDRKSRHNDLIAAAQEIGEQIDPNDPRGLSLPSGFTATCSAAFLDKRGLGPWGKAMVNAAVRVAPQCFYNKNLFGSICPNYLSLTNSQKNAMIAMAFAAIAQTESSCKPSAETAGVNDTAVGMFQLEKSANVRRQSGRNSHWCQTQSNVNTKGWQFQSECSVSIIEDTVCSWKSILFDSAGYWEKLRNNREITQRIRSTAKKWGFCE